VRRTPNDPGLAAVALVELAAAGDAATINRMLDACTSQELRELAGWLAPIAAAQPNLPDLRRRLVRDDEDRRILAAYEDSPPAELAEPATPEVDRIVVFAKIRPGRRVHRVDVDGGGCGRITQRPNGSGRLIMVVPVAARTMSGKGRT
jgi:hypothetical protein